MEQLIRGFWVKQWYDSKEHFGRSSLVEFSWTRVADVKSFFLGNEQYIALKVCIELLMQKDMADGMHEEGLYAQFGSFLA